MEGERGEGGKEEGGKKNGPGRLWAMDHLIFGHLNQWNRKYDVLTCGSLLELRLTPKLIFYIGSFDALVKCIEDINQS